MARARRAPQQDLLSRLADAGEAAIQRLSDAPGADQLLGAANALRDRLDELQRRVRGLEALEQRVAELERKVDRLSRGGAGAAARSTATRKKTATAGKTTSTKTAGAATEASRSRAGRTRA